MNTNLAASQIEIAKEQLIKALNPLAIYLFGSFAWGSPHEDSDLDLLVVIEDYYESRHKMLAAGHLALARLKLPKDILLYNKEEFEIRSQTEKTLCHKIKLKGVQIYGRA